MITDKDIQEYFEHNPKSKGVAIIMVDLADCDNYDDYGVELKCSNIEHEAIILNEGEVVG